MKLLDHRVDLMIETLKNMVRSQLSDIALITFLLLEKTDTKRRFWRAVKKAGRAAKNTQYTIKDHRNMFVTFFDKKKKKS
jgi:hypothetical protein